MFAALVASQPLTAFLRFGLWASIPKRINPFWQIGINEMSEKYTPIPYIFDKNDFQLKSQPYLYLHENLELEEEEEFTLLAKKHKAGEYFNADFDENLYCGIRKAYFTDLKEKEEIDLIITDMDTDSFIIIGIIVSIACLWFTYLGVVGSSPDKTNLEIFEKIAPFLILSVVGIIATATVYLRRKKHRKAATHRYKKELYLFGAYTEFAIEELFSKEYGFKPYSQYLLSKVPELEKAPEKTVTTLDIPDQNPV